MNCSIWSIDRILTGISTSGQSGPESNGNEGVLHIPQVLKLEPHYRMQFNAIPIMVSRIAIEHFLYFEQNFMMMMMMCSQRGSSWRSRATLGLTKAMGPIKTKG